MGENNRTVPSSDDELEHGLLCVWGGIVEQRWALMMGGVDNL